MLSHASSKNMNKLKYVGTLLKEFMGFALENKVYWILPLVLILLLLAFVVVTGQGTVSYLYTLF